MPTSYASVIEGMINGCAHVGVHGPNSYIIAKEKDPTLEVFATYVKEGHLHEEGPGYRAALIVRADSEFDSIESLEGTVLGLADPASTSSNLLPRVVVKDEIGGAPTLEDYCSKVVYSGGHDLSTLAIKEGRVDSAFVATHRFDNVVGRGLASIDEFRVLWQSPVIPQNPSVYDSDLCEPISWRSARPFWRCTNRRMHRSSLENINSARLSR